jgi:hypothetical protein
MAIGRWPPNQRGRDVEGTKMDRGGDNLAAQFAQCQAELVQAGHFAHHYPWCV